jgi:hypothetical protein
VGGSLHNDIVAGRNKRQLVAVMLDELERALKSPGHLKERLATKAESRPREVNVCVLVEQLEDLWSWITLMWSRSLGELIQCPLAFVQAPY